MTSCVAAASNGVTAAKTDKSPEEIRKAMLTRNLP